MPIAYMISRCKCDCKCKMTEFCTTPLFWPSLH